MSKGPWICLAALLLTSAACGDGQSTGDKVVVTMDPFTVPAGAEVYKCQSFANPFGGKDGEVQAFESHMTPGSHHLLLFYDVAQGDGPLEDCSGLEFAPTPFSTQIPDDTQVYPEGVAALIPRISGLRLQSHYLNTTGQPVEAKVSVTFHLAEPGTVTDYAGVVFVVETNINVPPQSTGVVKHDCTLPHDMSLIKAGSHMHKHGTEFTATIAGEEVFHTTNWDEPEPVLFDPPRAVSAGDKLSFSCTYVNDSSQTLAFGESAATDEMCIFVAPYYPVTSPVNVTIPCQ